MKRIWLILCLMVCIALPGCGSKKEAEPVTQTEEKLNPDEYLSIEFGDVIDVVGNNQRHLIHLDNESEYFLNGIVYAVIKDEHGDEIYREAIFLVNEEPHGYESGAALIPIGAKVGSCTYEIVRLEASNGPVKSPEITDDNVYNYIFYDYRVLDSLAYGEHTVSGALHNLTTQYFSGRVIYTIKDDNGNILDVSEEKYENISPGSQKSVVLMMKETDKYSIEYDIVEYSFSDEPMQ